MAATSLWRIKGRVERLLDYIENQEKTLARPPDKQSEKISIQDVLDYVTRKSATDSSKLVTAINCKLETAVKTMKETKEHFGKTGGTIAYHGYQSFKEGEVTPQQAHMIGTLLAEQLWGGRYEVLVATHVDKESHIHNHFVINTVSFVDGKKFHRTKEDYRRMQEVSDRLGEDYELEEIRCRILENIRREPVIPEEEKARAGRWRKEHPPRTKHTGLAALYYYYCYELHILVKYPASAKRVSYCMRKDLLKLDQLDEQTRLLGKHEIRTFQDLERFREETKAQITDLSVLRDQKRKELKKLVSSGNEEEAVGMRVSIAGINTGLAKLRKELKTTDRVEERAIEICREMEKWTEQKGPEENRQTGGKEENRDELFRRSGGAGREDVLKRH